MLRDFLFAVVAKAVVTAEIDRHDQPGSTHSRNPNQMLSGAQCRIF